MCQPFRFGTFFVYVVGVKHRTLIPVLTQSYVITIKNTRIMNIKPLSDRVLVLPAPAEEKVGGIIIPDTAKEKPQRGKVVAVGLGTKDEPMILKENDVVLYGKYAGTELEYQGEKYLMMRQSDILAVLAE